MFAKSGRKLIRLSLPEIIDSKPKEDTKPNNQVNGQIRSILDELESKGCTVTTITPDPSEKDINCISPIKNTERIPKTTNTNQVQELSVKKNCNISSNDILHKSQPRPADHVNTYKTNSRTTSCIRPNAARSPRQKRLVREKGKHLFRFTEIPQFIKVVTASKANNSFTDAALDSNDRLSSTESGTITKPLPERKDPTVINFRRFLNGTQYVCYTPPAPNSIRRDRLIQANENEIKNTLETAVQCDLIEDESSSESSQSDWISEIIEDYEFLDDDDMFECRVCGEVCRSHYSHLKHSMTHKESSLLCFRCGRLFPNTSKLLEHEEKMHIEDNLKIKKALRCPKLNCHKAFHSKRQLFDHIDQHCNRTTEHQCSKCKRTFTTALQLLSHVNRRSCFR